MINKEIKTKTMAKNVAEELMADLRAELDIFGSYQVRMYDTKDTIEVKVVSECSCAVITSPVVGNIMSLVAIYTKVYPYNVSYHLDVEEREHDGMKDYIPAFVFCVRHHSK